MRRRSPSYNFLMGGGGGNDFENFKSAFIPLKKELMYIDKHSDYNSDDYIPVTSEIENSLNEKYINLFKFILLVSSMQ